MRTCILTFMAAVVLLIFAATAAFSGTAPTKPPAKTEQYSISGPYISDNLTVYLIHGQDQIKGKKIITLDQALAEQLVTVYETGNVNELAVENKSDCVVFIQSGDIVKGGRQDRTIQYDMLLMPKSGRKALPVFCVEHGRWSQRAAESDRHFARSANCLVGKELKIAAKSTGAQTDVWNQVEKQQAKLQAQYAAPVRSTVSESSLQLTLEQRPVADGTKAHSGKLKGIVDKEKNAIGFAFAINCKINSADVYASSELFRKLWPKLLASSATEALAEKGGKTCQAPANAEVLKFMARVDKAPVRDKVANKTYRMTEQQCSDGYSFRTEWYSAPSVTGGAGKAAGRSGDAYSGASVHSNYIAK
jgi:hypothetical protein